MALPAAKWVNSRQVLYLGSTPSSTHGLLLALCPGSNQVTHWPSKCLNLWTISPAQMLYLNVLIFHQQTDKHRQHVIIFQKLLLFLGSVRERVTKSGPSWSHAFPHPLSLHVLICPCLMPADGHAKDSFPGNGFAPKLISQHLSCCSDTFAAGRRGEQNLAVRDGR